MKTARWRFVWFLAFLILLGLLLLLLRTPNGPKPGTISLSVANYTARGPSALFSVSNGNRWAIVFRPGMPQVRSNSLWSPVEITEGAMPRLGPGQCTTFSVAAPTNGDAWRVPVLFFSVPPQAVAIAEYHTYTIYQKMVSLLGGRPPSRPDNPRDTNFTPEITRRD